VQIKWIACVSRAGLGTAARYDETNKSLEWAWLKLHPGSLQYTSWNKMYDRLQHPKLFNSGTDEAQ
jgi:hypothetical protein